MGVRGLDSFLKHAFTSYGDRVSLNGCTVVVDGSSWVYYLLSKLDRSMTSYGMDYGALRALALEYAGNFHCTETSCVYVFDGPRRDAAKMSTKLDRMLRACRDANRVVDTAGQSGSVLPLHAMRCVIQALQTFGACQDSVPSLTLCAVHISSGEADMDIARIAASMGACAIVSNDTDFLIYQYPMTGQASGPLSLAPGLVSPDSVGFFTTTDIKPDADISNTEAVNASGKCVAYAFRFCSHKVARSLRLCVRDLPVLATLMGNDYTPPGMLANIHAGLKKSTTETSTGAKRGRKKMKKNKSKKRSKDTETKRHSMEKGGGGDEDECGDKGEGEGDGDKDEGLVDHGETLTCISAVFEWRRCQRRAVNPASSGVLLTSAEVVAKATQCILRAKAMEEHGMGSLVQCLTDCLPRVPSQSLVGIVEHSVAMYTVDTAVVGQESSDTYYLGQVSNDGIFLTPVVPEKPAITHTMSSLPWGHPTRSLSRCSFSGLLPMRVRIFTVLLTSLGATRDGVPQACAVCDVRHRAAVGPNGTLNPHLEVEELPFPTLPGFIDADADVAVERAVEWVLLGTRSPPFRLDKSMPVTFVGLCEIVYKQLVSEMRTTTMNDTESDVHDVQAMQYWAAFVRSLGDEQDERGGETSLLEPSSSLTAVQAPQVWVQLQVCVWHVLLLLEAINVFASSRCIAPMAAYNLDIGRLSFPAFLRAINDSVPSTSK